MARSKSLLRKAQSVIIRYGLAVLLVTAALGIAALLNRYKFPGMADPLSFVALAITAWYAGPGPALLALLFSFLAVDYFFIEPIYSLSITREEVPRFVVFALFSSGRDPVRRCSPRRFERDLLQSRDALEREVAERTQQASLLNLTHDTIFVRDLSNVITYWNRGAQEMYGWTPEEAIGKRSHDLLHTIFPAPIDDIKAELLRTARWEGELRRTKADGGEVVVSSRWSLRRDQNAQPAAILETNNDITAARQREEEIRGLNQVLARRSTELEASNKELEAFAYSVSHDLRAPLRHMVGFAELLQKKALPVLDDKSRRYMMVILDSAKRMGNLIDDLLSFSRIGRVETQKTSVNLEQLAREALSDVRQETTLRFPAAAH